MLRQSALRTLRNASTAPAMRQRAMHVDNKVYNNMPFDYRKGGPFGVKLVLFTGFGFSIPFLAAKFQNWKATQ